MTKNTDIVQDTVKQTEAAVSAGQAQLENVVTSSQAAATKQVEQVSEVASRGYNDAVSLNTANVEAVVRAATIAGERFETVGREIVSFAQERMDSHVENVRKLFAAKSPQEFFAVQSEIAREGFEAAMAEGQKVGELSKQAATDAFEPIQSQVKTVFEKTLKPAA